MPARTELDRLGAACPIDPRATEVVVDAEEEERMLAEIRRAGRPVPALLPDRRPKLRWAALAGGVTVAVAAAAAGVGVVVTASPPVPAPAATSVPTRPTAPRHRPQSVTLRLASYTFELPAGFAAHAADECAGLPALAPAVPVEGSGGAATAAGAGGCVEVELAGGPAAAVPSGAAPVAVGPYDGFLVTEASSRYVLYVEIPAASGDHALVLASVGISAGQLVAIAESGLPGSVGTPQPCTRGCG